MCLCGPESPHVGARAGGRGNCGRRSRSGDRGRLCSARSVPERRIKLGLHKNHRVPTVTLSRWKSRPQMRRSQLQQAGHDGAAGHLELKRSGARCQRAPTDGVNRCCDAWDAHERAAERLASCSGLEPPNAERERRHRRWQRVERRSRPKK